jgi:hypothetical protein
MMDTQPDQFSQLIASVFAKLGISEPWAETILLHDRRYIETVQFLSCYFFES